jgi:NADH-quinone oxidoreductase subunit A
VSEFLRAYLTVAILGAAAFLMVGAMLGAGRLIRPSRPQRQKYINYESGVDPMGGAFPQSQIRYYVFALLFLLFDIEAVFIFPWAVQFTGLAEYGLILMTVFVVVLDLGILYAWRKGVLRWV